MSDSYCTTIGLLRSSTDRVVIKAEMGFDQIGRHSDR